MKKKILSLRWQRRRRGGTAGGYRRRPVSRDFYPSPDAHLVAAEETGTTWQVRTVSRSTSEERIRAGTPSRASVLLLDSVGGRSVPASVRGLIMRSPDGREPRLTPIIEHIGGKVQWMSRDLYYIKGASRVGIILIFSGINISGFSSAKID